MNKYLLFLMTFVLFNCKEAENDNPPMSLDNVQPEYITKADAQAILGEAAHLTDSTMKNKKNAVEYNLTYVSDAVDVKTGKTGNIYYMFEQYEHEAAANEVYDDIYKANASHEGIKVLTGIGDEAYFHTDSENFYFIMIRKGTKMIRMKVNKLTSLTSIDQFNSIAKRIADKL
ncbi:MAG: hypothetical protein ABI761_15610 [Saprospiraceae bacterium]